MYVCVHACVLVPTCRYIMIMKVVEAIGGDVIDIYKMDGLLMMSLLYKRWKVLCMQQLCVHK